MSTTPLETFEQARTKLRASRERLRLDRQTYNSYKRQAQRASMPVEQQQQYCAQALARVTTSIAAVTQARADAEAAYEAIPVAERPVLDYWD